MIIESNPFRLTSSAYLAYVRHYRYVKSKFYKLFVFTSLSAMTGFAAYLFYMGNDGGALSVLTLAALLAVWFFVVLDVLCPLWGFWLLRRGGSYAADCKIYIDENDIWTIDAISELKRNWKGVDCVMETRKYIFIYFNKYNAFIVPKNAFDNLDAAESFQLFAKEALNRAKFSVAV